MSAATARAPGFYEWAFKSGGDPYFAIPVDVINKLPTFWRTAAMEVAGAIMILAREGNFHPTAAEIAARLPSDCRQPKGSPPGHRSISFVQKGLHALDVLLRLLRRTRRRGRRYLDWIKGLVPRNEARAARPEDPPAPPSGGKKEELRDTTTREPSSSSSISTPEGTGEPDPAGLDALYRRARELVDGVSRGDVRAAILRFTAEWVGKALDVMERRNRKPGNARKPWGYVLGILLNRQEKGDWPDDPKPAAAAAAVKAADPAEEEREAAEKAREKALRERWGLLTEPEREAIEAEVRASNPGLARFRPMFEAACMARMDERQAADPHRRE